MTRTAKISITGLLLGGWAGVTPMTLFGAAFDLPDQDAFVIGRGMAFVATADNPSAIYYNPAGISQGQGHHVRAGVYGIYLGPEYRSPGGREFHNQIPYNAIPQLYYTFGLEGTPWSFGLGIYSPFGLSVRWPQDTGLRTVATQGSLMTAAINPVAAFKLGPRLSVGGGILINYAKIDLRQGLTPIPHNDIFQFKGDAWDVGYNLGVLWQPHEKLSFGGTFRSALTPDFEGKTKSAFTGFQPTTYSRASAEFPFPLKAIVGVSYRPTSAWNLEFNADFTDWRRVRTVVLKQKTPPPVVPFPEVPLTLELQSSCYYEFGATRYFANGWSISLGYIFNENSTPERHYQPLLVDLDRHFWSVGVGRRGKRYDFDVAYQFGYGPTRTVSGSAPSPAGQSADGRYEFFSHALSVSVGVRF